MIDYSEILNTGELLVPKKRGSAKGACRKEVLATTHRNKGGSRVAIAIPNSVCKDLGLVKGESFNLVTLPNGKICLCKVRADLGFRLAQSNIINRSRIHYVFLPRLETTTTEAIVASIEDGLIVFEEGSFNSLLEG